MADLDLEAAVSLRRSLGEEPCVVLVAEMEIETARIGAHPRIVSAEEAIERQARLLCREVPAGLVDRLLERQGHAPDIAAARPPDAMDEAGRRLAFEAGPRLLAERSARSPQAPAADGTGWQRSRGRCVRHLPAVPASRSGRGRCGPGCRRSRGRARIETASAGSPRCAFPTRVIWVLDIRYRHLIDQIR